VDYGVNSPQITAERSRAQIRLVKLEARVCAGIKEVSFLVSTRIIRDESINPDHFMPNFE
jgi:hypothetical protein